MQHVSVDTRTWRRVPQQQRQQRRQQDGRHTSALTISTEGQQLIPTPSSPLQSQRLHRVFISHDGDSSDDGATEQPVNSALPPAPHPRGLSSLSRCQLLLIISLAALTVLGLSLSTLHFLFGSPISSTLLPLSGLSPFIGSPASAAFAPPAVDLRCFCSQMYVWPDGPRRDPAFPNRLPWQLSPARSYAQWDDCSMLVPRSALIHGAPPLPGPALHSHGSITSNASSRFWQLPACMAYDVWLPTGGSDSAAAFTPPVFSLQLTVFDQGRVLVPHLWSLLAQATEAFELVVVFDDCTDRSIPLAHAFIDALIAGCGAAAAVGHREQIPTFSSSNVTLPAEYNASSRCLNPSLVHVRTLVQPTGVWETAANNLGARAASPHAAFLVLLQDDMRVRSPGWNSLLALPLRLWPDEVIAVSGLCALQQYSLAASSLGPPSHVGRCITHYWDIRWPLAWEAERRCLFYIRDSAVRGPLLISQSAMRQLRYLDELHFSMDDSDHDLFTRAYYERGWSVGLLPIDFTVDTSIGGVRRSDKPPLPDEAKAYLQARRERAANSTSALATIMRQYNSSWIKHDDDRPLKGSLYQRCVAYYRSNLTLHADWYLINDSRTQGFLS